MSCIDYNFVKRHCLPVTKLETPIRSTNTDGLFNKKDICYMCTLFINIKGITQKIVFYVISLKDNIILGLPWLCSTNPTINWAARTLSINKSVDKSKFLFIFHEKDIKWHSSFFQPPTHLPKHINVDAISDSQLFEYNQWDEEIHFYQQSMRGLNYPTDRLIWPSLHPHGISSHHPPHYHHRTSNRQQSHKTKGRPSPQIFTNFLCSPRKPLTTFPHLNPMTMK